MLLQYLQVTIDLVDYYTVYYNIRKISNWDACPYLPSIIAIRAVLRVRLFSLVSRDTRFISICKNISCNIFYLLCELKIYRYTVVHFIYNTILFAVCLPQ